MTEKIWNQNLYDLFEQNFPILNRPFIEKPDGGILTYGYMKKMTGIFSNALDSLGVTIGDMVIVQTNKSPEVVFLYLACLKTGAIFVPLNTAYTQSELEYFISDSDPKVVICDPKSPIINYQLTEHHPDAHLYTMDINGNGSFTKYAESYPETFVTVPGDGTDIACILYTSGTTGQPKGAMLTHSNLGSNAITLRDAWGFTSDDTLLHVLPIFHAHGLFVAINTVLVNGTGMIFLPKFEVDEVCRLIPKTSVMMGVPTFYTRLLANEKFTRNLSQNMRLFVSGSAPLLAETHREFSQRTGHEILERYGMTETAMNTSNPLKGIRIPGSVGPALPGIEVRVVNQEEKILGVNETGDIHVRGPNVFNGYWKKPDKTLEEFCEDNFFRTGDLGYLDDKGYLFIVGRAKDLIISGGYNVYPKEIESCLDEINGIQESAVIGVPHKDFGEAVVAIVTYDKEKNLITEQDVIVLLKKVLASYKVPKAVFFVPDIPRNVMGKVEKTKLRKTYNQTFEE